jgi:hypothetical protein
MACASEPRNDRITPSILSALYVVRQAYKQKRDVGVGPLAVAKCLLSRALFERVRNPGDQERLLVRQCPSGGASLDTIGSRLKLLGTGYRKKTPVASARWFIEGCDADGGTESECAVPLWQFEAYS